MEQTMTHSVLGEARPRMPIAGRIRTGIKILTSTARQNPRAVQLYQELAAKGATYDLIERTLRDQCGFDKSPLTPRNTPYFRVSRNDFVMPELADRIMDLYAEDRGDQHGRQLYRFPVVFAFDSWLENMPHGLRSYTARGLQYWSEYDAAGTRFCLTYAQTPQSDGARRAARVWGGRGHVLRAENEGKCDPRQCREYQSNACKVTGRALFYVPGVPGSSLIELDTTSFYSMQQMRSQMELVHRLRNGRISGVHEGRPIFYLAKVQEEVSRIDNGEAKRVMQYLVRLEADVDMTQVFALQDSANAQALGTRAVAALTGTVEPAEAEAVVEPEAEQAEAATAEAPERTEVAADGKRGRDPAISAARRRVFGLIQTHAKPDAELIAELTTKHGEGWGEDLTLLQTIEAELIF